MSSRARRTARATTDDDVEDVAGLMERVLTFARSKKGFKHIVSLLEKQDAQKTSVKRVSKKTRKKLAKSFGDSSNVGREVFYTVAKGVHQHLFATKRAFVVGETPTGKSVRVKFVEKDIDEEGGVVITLRLTSIGFVDETMFGETEDTDETDEDEPSID